MALFSTLKIKPNRIPNVFRILHATTKQVKKLQGRLIITIMRPEASLTHCYVNKTEDKAC